MMINNAIEIRRTIATVEGISTCTCMITESTKYNYYLCRLTKIHVKISLGTENYTLQQNTEADMNNVVPKCYNTIYST